MKDKINIAELLKDCPKGMELDCINYDGVVIFEKVTNCPNYPIIISIKYNDKRCKHTLTKYGQTCKTPYNKCVIFPKGKTTWEGFQRPFKNGDILVGENSVCNYIFIYNGRISVDIIYYYACLTSLGRYSINSFAYKGNIRFATEEEKEKLFQAIKDNGYKWNAETKTLEKLIEPKFKVGDVIRLKSKPSYVYTIHCLTWDDNKQLAYNLLPNNDKHLILVSLNAQDNYELVPNKFDITTLKPFDKVLVRDNDKQKWTIDYFSFVDKEQVYPFVCIGHYVSQCIPYEENKHLLRTTNDCNEYYKTWKNE